jgi:S1-C subfamily serine protease
MASGDHIQIVNGEALDSIGKLRQLLHHNRAKSLHIEGLRAGEEREWSLVPVTMKPTGDPNLKRWRGLELEVSEEPGIYIVYVEAGTVGGRSGLAVDDRIVGLNGVEVLDSAALWSTLETLGDRPQLLLVRRGDQYLMLPTGP